MLTIDPGQKTGWVSIVFSLQQLVLLPAERRWDCISEWVAGELWGPEGEQAHELATMATKHQDMPSLVEDFILRKISSERELLAPVRVTARFEQQIWMWNNWGPEVEIPDFEPVRIYKQPPSDMYGHEAELHETGLWSPGLKDANQAGCHTLHFLLRLRRDANLRASAYPRERV